jgi:hypothetical protein
MSTPTVDDHVSIFSSPTCRYAMGHVTLVRLQACNEELDQREVRERGMRSTDHRRGVARRERETGRNARGRARKYERFIALCKARVFEVVVLVDYHAAGRGRVHEPRCAVGEVGVVAGAVIECGVVREWEIQSLARVDGAHERRIIIGVKRVAALRVPHNSDLCGLLEPVRAHHAEAHLQLNAHGRLVQGRFIRVHVKIVADPERCKIQQRDKGDLRVRKEEGA